MVPPEMTDSIQPVYVPMTKVNSDVVKTLLSRVRKVPGVQPVTPEVDPVTVEPSVAPEPEPTVIEPEAEPETLTIMSVAPFLARGGLDAATGVEYLYESDLILERQWSDGSVDYQCAKCLDYTSGKPLGVTGHNARKHGKAKTKNPRLTVVKRSDAEPIYDTAVKRLTTEIEKALDAIKETGKSFSAQELARVMVTARRERGAVLHEDPDPITPEEIIARVRALVVPEFVTYREEMTALLDSVRAEAEQQRQTAADEMRRRQRAEDTLHALVSLAREAETEVSGDSERRVG